MMLSTYETGCIAEAIDALQRSSAWTTLTAECRETVALVANDAARCTGNEECWPGAMFRYAVPD